MKKIQVVYIASTTLLVAAVCAGVYFFGVDRTNNRGSTNYNLGEGDITLDNQKISENNSLESQNIQVPEGARYYQAFYSQVIYEADKIFLNKPAQKVVGKAEDILTTGWFDDLKKQGYVKLVMEFSDFKTDSEKRDQDVTGLLFKNNQQILVEANFTDIELPLGKSLKTDQSFRVTLNGVTKEVLMNYEVRLEGNEVLATGSGVIKLSDFSLTAPSLANVYKVGDEVRLEFTIKGREVPRTGDQKK